MTDHKVVPVGGTINAPDKNERSVPAVWGARCLAGNDWSFAIWAPAVRKLALTINDENIPLVRDPSGTFHGEFSAEPGTAYALYADGAEIVDPAARWLDSIDGSARLSKIRAPTRLTELPDWAEAVILEIHIGTFTAEGTFAAAATRMKEIAALGITAIEIMPVAAFCGARGWGYDGIYTYAPHPAYGTPADLAELVDAIHAAGMIALLDVVYNHFGPGAGDLTRIAPDFFDHDRNTPWGDGIDYSRPEVRRFFIDNAVMWVRDYGFDGLRLDAVHQIADPSPVHVLDELAETVREAVDHPVHLIAEDDRNLPGAREEGTITANWNDDYHHAIHCLITGENESYYATFAVDPMADLVKALAEGHVEQGQTREGRDTPRGAPSTHLEPLRFVNANQTHDQIGNRAQGERLITLAEAEGQSDVYRIAHALLLCAPAVPMLVMGEEEGARAPFQFFADFGGDLGDAVRDGRRREFAALSQFGGEVPDPMALETFTASRPYISPSSDAQKWRDLTQQCLDFRRDRIAPLLRSERSARPNVVRTGPRSLHGTWPFHAGTLEIVAHLGGVPESPVAIEAANLTVGTANETCHFAVRVTEA